MGRFLILAGVLLLLAGLAWPWLSRLPIGRLPGDIVIDRPGVRVYLPLMSCLLVSAAVSLIAWLLRR
jgi:hypothetical protein